jgi:catechol 2,3-dioxygenase-like lactoylglutathione lyase family enzyme
MELVHTCYRITDPERSVAFYEDVFMGLPGDGDRLELAYNFGVDSCELGTGYGHIARGSGVPTCSDLAGRASPRRPMRSHPAWTPPSNGRDLSRSKGTPGVGSPGLPAARTG